MYQDQEIRKDLCDVQLKQFENLCIVKKILLFRCVVI